MKSGARMTTENTSARPAEPFDELAQQHHADQLGMWIFLATEVLFFGGLFASYSVYRFLSPEAFRLASHHLDVLAGTVDTAVLLSSSLTMALALRAIRMGQRGAAMGLLFTTAACGIGFLVLHGFEYRHEYHEHLFPGPHFALTGRDPQDAQMFFWLYFVTTGLHSLHVLIGVLLILTLSVFTATRRITSEKYMAVEIIGLYWHFVDIIWVFLFPLYYLAGAH